MAVTPKTKRSTGSDQNDPCAGSAAAVGVTLAEGEAAPSGVPSSGETQRKSANRLAWATLYRRAFDIDPLECSNCGGRMRFVE